MTRRWRSRIFIVITRWVSRWRFQSWTAHIRSMPALVGTLCICIVFAPVAMLKGVSKFLFTPLAMAVIFAMLTSYLLSRTLVATMAINLLPEDPNEHGIGGRVGEYLERFDQAFERFKGRYKSGLTT